MPFELNAAIPMSFQYGPTALEQMKEVVSLANILDTRKQAIRKAQAEAQIQRLGAEQATSALQRFTAPIPAPVAPTVRQLPQYTPEQFAQLPGVQAAPRGPLGSAENIYAGLTSSGKIEDPATRRLLSTTLQGQGISMPPEEIARVQGAVPAPGAQEEFAQQQAEYEKAQQQAELVPQQRVPEEYSWMKPTEYEHMLRLEQISFPEAQSYLDKLADRKYKLAQAEYRSKNKAGGFYGWKEKQDQWDAIQAMPEGEEKDRAVDDWRMRWATSTALTMTPEYVDLKRRQAGAMAEGAVTGKATGETRTGERATDYRNEFNNLPEIKSVKTLYSNAKKANEAYAAYTRGEITPYGVDQSLGYFASKALDPNSVVMPGEFDRFARGLGFAEGASAMINQLITGGLRLTDAQRAEMLKIVNNAMESGVVSSKRQYDYYARIAKKRGIDPDEVVGGMDYIFSEKFTKPDKSIRKGPAIKPKEITPGNTGKRLSPEEQEELNALRREQR